MTRDDLIVGRAFNHLVVTDPRTGLSLTTIFVSGSTDGFVSLPGDRIAIWNRRWVEVIDAGSGNSLGSGAKRNYTKMVVGLSDGSIATPNSLGEVDVWNEQVGWIRTLREASDDDVKALAELGGDRIIDLTARWHSASLVSSLGSRAALLVEAQACGGSLREVISIGSASSSQNCWHGRSD